MLVRANGAVFASALIVTVADPVPDAAPLTASHEALLDAVQVHPACVVRVTGIDVAGVPIDALVGWMA